MNTPEKKSGLGCLFNLLITLAVLALSLGGCGYVAVMHTALPFKALAKLVEAGSTNVNLRITGISGSISSGFDVKSIQWTGGNIADVRMKYNGFRNLMSKKELILHEVKVGLAHFDIAGWKSNRQANTTTNALSPAQTDTSISTLTNSSNSTLTNTSGGEPALKLFQIDRLTIKDVALTNSLTGFSLVIPALEWTGFKASKGTMEFGQLTVDSDRLKISTQPARTAGFKKHIEVSLLPKLHPVIRRPVDLLVDLGGEGSNVFWRAKAFADRLEFETKPDHTVSLHCKGLDMADYFDAPLPQKLTVEMDAAASEKQKTYPARIRGGSFVLGLCTFKIPAQEVSTNSSVFAIGHMAERTIRYQIDQSDDAPYMRQRLSTQPALSALDTLALVFYGKLCTDLSDAEQLAVSQKLPVFTGEPKE